VRCIRSGKNSFKVLNCMYYEKWRELKFFLVFLSLVDLGEKEEKAQARLIANIACVQHPEIREQVEMGKGLRFIAARARSKVEK